MITINGTTGIAGANGSASTPAVQGEDTNTGVFFPAADTIAFAEGGAEVARFNSSGNLLLGTTVDIQKLSLARNTSIGWVNGAGNGSDQIIYADSSSNLNFYTGATERARIDSSGNLLVGTTATLNVFSGTTDGVSLEGVGTVVASRNNEAAAFLRRRSTNGQIVAFLRDTTQVGNISVTTTATSYVTSSDYRLKENVQPMQDALAVIAQLNPVTYTWKVDGSDGQGFIAHELQAVVPDCVSGEKDAVDAEGNPQYQGVDTSFLVATLVAAIKELKAEVDSLKAQLEAN
jgi:hypothetical protein